MSPGSIARRLLGKRLFRAAGRRYRSLFVDFDELVDCLPDLKAGGVILDVGGGDGDLHNWLLSRHPTARSILVDRGPRVGDFIEPGFRDRVSLHPNTNLDEALGKLDAPPDWLFVSDVIHHVPVAERPAFARSIGRAAAEGDTIVIIKDVQPGSLRARAALLLDRYVSGDREARFLSQDEMQALLTPELAGFACTPTPLLARDGFNYCLIWQRAQEAPRN